MFLCPARAYFDMDLFHSGIPYTYLGLQADFAKAKVAILPVPYDSTASYRTGQREGPAAIIAASRQLELYDVERKMDLSAKIGFHTLNEMTCSKKDPAQVVKAVEESVDELLEKKKWPLMLGGEHSITSGAVKAAKKYFSDLTVLHLDAHADMRLDYEGTPYNHASVMARCREMVPVVSVGVRSYSEEEKEAVEGKYADVIFDASSLTPSRITAILSKIKTKYVYITIDVDGLDPSIVPSVGTPEPGGLDWHGTLALLRAVGAQKQVVAADVVELCPIPGLIYSDFTCAKLAYKLAGYCLIR